MEDLRVDNRISETTIDTMMRSQVVESLMTVPPVQRMTVAPEPVVQEPMVEEAPERQMTVAAPEKKPLSSGNQGSLKRTHRQASTQVEFSSECGRFEVKAKTSVGHYIQDCASRQFFQNL